MSNVIVVFESTSVEVGDADNVDALLGLIGVEAEAAETSVTPVRVIGCWWIEAGRDVGREGSREVR